MIAKSVPSMSRTDYAMRETEREAARRGIEPMALLNEKLATEIANLARMNQELADQRKDSE